MDIFKKYFDQFTNAVVTLSGGADSACVLMMAVEYLGRDNVMAATCVNSHFFRSEIDTAKEVAKKLDVPHMQYSVTMPKEFYKGGWNRCYHCKKTIMSALLEDKGFSAIFDGTNHDDNLEERRGSLAIKELGIKSPLHDLGLGKKFVHNAVRDLGIEFSDESCKATRLEGKIDDIRMSQVEDFEAQLKETLPGIRYRIDNSRIEFKRPLKMDSEQFELVNTLKTCTV